MPLRSSVIACVSCLALATIVGCKSGGASKFATTKPTTVPGLTPLTVDTELSARVVPPVGWRPDPIKASAHHKHLVWLSPSGRTAYGVIKLDLPLPVGHDLALWGFLNEMRRTEGEAKLISKEWDDQLNGLRFVAEGGLYLLRTNLFVDGFTGWAFYAATLRAQPIDPDELKLAETAREHTRVGVEGK